jgi:hypothetical protein
MVLLLVTFFCLFFISLYLSPIIIFYLLFPIMCIPYYYFPSISTIIFVHSLLQSSSVSIIFHLFPTINFLPSSAICLLLSFLSVFYYYLSSITYYHLSFVSYCQLTSVIFHPFPIVIIFQPFPIINFYLFLIIIFCLFSIIIILIRSLLLSFIYFLS